jgi:DNA-directed RNA polymerase specialized sigma24 family protein
LDPATQESFDALLSWLGPERETAGQKYEFIRSGLIRVFVSRGFSDAEDLADLTITRVTNRLSDIRNDYVGEQATYFYGVARNIIKEAVRRKEIATDQFSVLSSDISNSSDEYDCLMRCLKFLPQNKRELILDYHSYSGHDKVDCHRRMAHELSISENALRGRAHNIRANLEKCVIQCKEHLRSTQKPIRKHSS